MRCLLSADAGRTRSSLESTSTRGGPLLSQVGVFGSFCSLLGATSCLARGRPGIWDSGRGGRSRRNWRVAVCLFQGHAHPGEIVERWLDGTLSVAVQRISLEAILWNGGLPIALRRIDLGGQYEGNRGPGQRWRRARRDRCPAVYEDPLQPYRPKPAAHRRHRRKTHVADGVLARDKGFAISLHRAPSCRGSGLGSGPDRQLAPRGNAMR